MLQSPAFDAKVFFASKAPGRSRLKIPAKGTIFQQGDKASAVFWIEKGGVQITIVSEQGKTAIIAQLGAGEFFGEGCLAGQKLHLATATSIGPTVIVQTEKAAMVRALYEQPEFSEVFTAYLLLRNMQIEADLVDHLCNSSERRLARLLLILSNFAKEGSADQVIPKVSHEVLAARVGTTRARINFFMNKFRKLGLIEYSTGLKGLKVHPALLSVVIHE